jgi:hypothetical protein
MLSETQRELVRLLRADAAEPYGGYARQSLWQAALDEEVAVPLAMKFPPLDQAYLNDQEVVLRPQRRAPGALGCRRVGAPPNPDSPPAGRRLSARRRPNSGAAIYCRVNSVRQGRGGHIAAKTTAGILVLNGCRISPPSQCAAREALPGRTAKVARSQGCSTSAGSGDDGYGRSDAR